MTLEPLTHRQSVFWSEIDELLVFDFDQNAIFDFHIETAEIYRTKPHT